MTVMLMYSVTCYGRRRLWRGPHWVDALNQVRDNPLLITHRYAWLLIDPASNPSRDSYIQ